ncbi:hypothetical protein D9611_008225 [Ephemerocybe angulata]|uniref:Ankyrin n=1 Tax=Ephemerocybe angulata TaxID=980116 RepID=A0A8H5BIF3_9AGAR|nr:hypothetical protein D9611_008225 [Tulosesus angulatus]
MSAGSCKIPGNPDIAGVGVRIAIYVQNLLCFFPAFWALVDGKVTKTELESAETQATTNLVLAFAILISSMVQATTLGLTSYHASIVLNMSWMNNTNAFIYFLLYVHHKSQVSSTSGHVVEPTFRAWARHIRCSFLPGSNSGPGNDTSIAESGQLGGLSVQAVGDETGMPTLPSPRARPEKVDGADALSNVEAGIEHQKADVVNTRTAAKNLVKRYVLPLGSLHLSLMAALGLWLWIDIRGFGNMGDTANDCAAEHALISILGSHVPFASGALRIASFVIYGLFLVPGLNLLLPVVVFLGFYYCARGSPPTLIRPSPRPFSMSWYAMIRLRFWGLFWRRFWRRLWVPATRWVQEFIARWWSIFPPVLGLLFLLAINLVFIIDIELTLKQNAHLQGKDEAEWGFGQILAILLLFMPLRDLAEALLARRMQKEVNLGFKNAVNLKDWDSVIAFLARGADPNVVTEGETTAIRAACFSDRVDVIKALLDAGSDPNIEPGPTRDAKIIQRENRACLQLLRNYDNHGVLVLGNAVLEGYGAGVKLLLAAPGINLNAPDTNGWTPLSLAVREGREAIAQLLLAAPGIDVNAQDTKGRTALKISAQNGDEAIVKLLLAAPGINLNTPDTNGWTPLSLAVREGREAIAQLLLAAPGIDVNAQDTKGRTALKFAAQNGDEAIVKLLLAAPGIDVNAACTSGRTALIFAAQCDHKPVVKLLLAAPEINVNARDANGWTALIWAAFGGIEDIVKVLCTVPATFCVDVSVLKRCLENPPEGRQWEKPAPKDRQDRCVRIMEEIVEGIIEEQLNRRGAMAVSRLLPFAGSAI